MAYADPCSKLSPKLTAEYIWQRTNKMCLCISPFREKIALNACVGFGPADVGSQTIRFHSRILWGGGWGFLVNYASSGLMRISAL